MKKSRIILVILLILSSLFALFGCQPNTDGNRNREIFSINHRGYGDAPENTLVAFRMSSEMGFNMVECDVRFTKDDKAVLLHDDTVDRTSNGKGKIADLTLEEVKELDFGIWKNKSFIGEKIPTFEEFILLCVELGLCPYVEVKGEVTVEQAQTLVDVAEKADIAVTWISYDRNVITWLADMRPEDRFGLVTTFIKEEQLQFLTELSNSVEVFIDANYWLLSRRRIKLCADNGIPLEVWTVNSKSRIKHLDTYVSGVTSDYLNAQTIFDSL